MLKLDLSGQSRFQERVARKGRCAICFEIYRLELKQLHPFGSKQLILPKHIWCFAPDTQFYMDPQEPVNMKNKCPGTGYSAFCVTVGADRMALDLLKRSGRL
jgi:hypothetical protein